MVDEVRLLLDRGIPPEDLIYYGLEYKYLTLYATGQISYDTMYTQLETAIHQFAKRQMTWFRGMERRGFTIHWLDAALPTEEKISRVLSMLPTDASPPKKKKFLYPHKAKVSRFSSIFADREQRGNRPETEWEPPAPQHLTMQEKSPYPIGTDTLLYKKAHPIP